MGVPGGSHHEGVGGAPGGVLGMDLGYEDVVGAEPVESRGAGEQLGV